MKKQIVVIATAVMMTATMTACSTPTQVVPTNTAESVQEIVLSESDVKSEVDVKPTSTPTTSVKPIAPNGVNVNTGNDVDKDSEPITQATQKPKETEEVKKAQEDEQETSVASPKPVTSDKPIATSGVEIVIPQTPQEVPQETPKPTATPEPVQTPTATATPAPTPEPTPEPVEEMKSLGRGYNSDVLAGINEVRASQGNAPLVLDSGMCSKALAHAKAMAEKGEIFHSGLGIESVSNSSEGGRSLGIRSAGHAGGLATNGEITKLGVGAVTYKGEQYTVVFSSTRY